MLFTIINKCRYTYSLTLQAITQSITNTMSQISDITMSPRGPIRRDNNNYNNISLFIAHVFPNYSPADVAAVFERLRIGKVRSVDFVTKWDRYGRSYFAAYIHFQHWFDNIAARNFQARVLNPKQEARIVYDDPWHWIVLPYTSNKKIDRQVSAPSKSQQRIDDDFAFTDAHFAKVYPEISNTRAEMEDALKHMEEEERCLATFDSRYVLALEQENQAWRQWLQSWYSKATEPIATATEA